MRRERRVDEDFAAWVRRVREEQGLSQQAVANRANNLISQQYIAFVENRDKLPTDFSLKKLVALARGLNVPIWDLLREALDMPLAQDALPQRRAAAVVANEVK